MSARLLRGAGVGMLACMRRQRGSCGGVARHSPLHASQVQTRVWRHILIKTPSPLCGCLSHLYLTSTHVALRHAALESHCALTGGPQQSTLDADLHAAICAICVIAPLERRCRTQSHAFVSCVTLARVVEASCSATCGHQHRCKDHAKIRRHSRTLSSRCTCTSRQNACTLPGRMALP
jgi:hypothetical protein